MDKKEKKKKIIFICIITIIGLLVDQISKLYIRNIFSRDLCNIECIKEPCNCLLDLLKNGGTYNGFNVVPGKGIEIIKDFFYLIEVKNTGGAWGMFSGNAPILALISAVVIAVLIYFLKGEKKITRLSITYYGMLFAGIIGNLIDRLFNGYVTDLFNFYIFNYDYPVFNVADIFIVLGIFLMIIDVIRGEKYAYKERKRKYKN